jgi:hypothetical protein
MPRVHAHKRARTHTHANTRAQAHRPTHDGFQVAGPTYAREVGARGAPLHDAPADISAAHHLGLRLGDKVQVVYTLVHVLTEHFVACGAACRRTAHAADCGLRGGLEGCAARATQDSKIQQDFLSRVELAEFAVKRLTRDPFLHFIHLVEPADEVEPVVGACFRTVVAHAPFERRSVPQSSQVIVKVTRTCKVVLQFGNTNSVQIGLDPQPLREGRLWSLAWSWLGTTWGEGLVSRRLRLSFCLGLALGLCLCLSVSVAVNALLSSLGYSGNEER